MPQYTVRNVPDGLDRALREWARRRKISLNSAIVDALKRGVGMEEEQEKSDLDDLIGTWQEDTEFDQGLADQDTIEPDLWR
jgi:plasmid stability protein